MEKLGKRPLFFDLCMPGQKHLAVAEATLLSEFERESGCALGISHPAKKRPCIFWKTPENSKKYFEILFLTSSRLTPLAVDLSLCRRKEKDCRRFPFREVCFGFFDKSGKLAMFPIKRLELVKRLYYCGPCEEGIVLKNF